MDKVNDFKLAVTAVVALLTSLWGWFGWLVVLFVGCMAVDYSSPALRQQCTAASGRASQHETASFTRSAQLL